VWVTGPVDITTAEDFARQLLATSRGGVTGLRVDLSAVTHLASAGVQALFDLRDRFESQRQALTLVAVAGSPAQVVMTLVSLPHHTNPDDTDAKAS
jgi:anti-anti-sigma regulatory factor